MKDADPLLINLLSSRKQFDMAELYTIKLIDIDVPIRLTSLDINVIVDGIVYKSAPISRGTIIETIGTSVDDLSVEWNLKQTDTIPGGSVPMVQSMRQGAFDGATLTLDKVFSPNPWTYNMPSISSRYVLKNRFLGLVDVEKATLLSASLKITSYTKLLNVKMPRNLFTSGCSRTFYSNDCGVSRDHLTSQGITQIGTKTSITTNLTFNDSYYNLGVITFTSGGNTGIRRSIRSSSNGIIYPILPLPFTPQYGDTFTIYPGCPKTRVSCASFNNSINFRGFPYIPVPETSL